MARIPYVRVVDLGDGVEQSVPEKRFKRAAEGRYRLLEDVRATDGGGNPLPPGELADSRPTKNASTDAWRAYARKHGAAHGLSPEQVEEMSRDDLAGHFTEEN